MADGKAVRMEVEVGLKGLERVHVALAVLDELKHQAARWGGQQHDDAHSLREWLGFIGKALRKAQLALKAGRVLVGERGPVRSSGPLAEKAAMAMRAAALEQVLDELRQVAALAVAAMESQVRQGLRVRSRSEHEAVRAASRRS